MASRDAPGSTVPITAIDSHHHLYDNARSRYTIAEFRDDINQCAEDGIAIAGSIYVECGEHYDLDAQAHLAPTGETAWVAELADSRPLLGMVAHADPSSPRFGDTLLAHLSVKEGFVRGIRCSTAWDPDPALQPPTYMETARGKAATDQFISGVRTLADFGLAFDAFVNFHQLGDILKLACSAPGVQIVVDHMGAPLGIGRFAADRSAALEETRRLLSPLSQLENVTIKLGGFGRPLTGTGWQHARRSTSVGEVVAYWSDHVHWLIDTFGPEHCAAESNYPIDRAGMGYRTIWRALDELTAGYTVSERDAIFRGTSERVYGLLPRTS